MLQEFYLTGSLFLNKPVETQKSLGEVFPESFSWQLSSFSTSVWCFFINLTDLMLELHLNSFVFLEHAKNDSTVLHAC